MPHLAVREADHVERVDDTSARNRRKWSRVICLLAFDQAVAPLPSSVVIADGALPLAVSGEADYVERVDYTSACNGAERSRVVCLLGFDQAVGPLPSSVGI